MTDSIQSKDGTGDAAGAVLISNIRFHTLREGSVSYDNSDGQTVTHLCACTTYADFAERLFPDYVKPYLDLGWTDEQHEAEWQRLLNAPREPHYVSAQHYFECE